jgi:GT2 family glycosyltransferase
LKITLIICSMDDTRFTRAAQHYVQGAQGEEFEIIRVPDAKSLAEGYNRALTRARGDIIFFSHDDVEFAAPNFWKRIRGHIEHCDILGVAGALYYSGGQWGSIGPPFLAGQVANPLSSFKPDQEGFIISIFGVNSPRMDGLHVVDGLFMAVRRHVFDKVQFDEVTFDGFHGYDLDFTYSAYRHGLRLSVATDVAPIHQSPGKFDKKWEEYEVRLFEKHGGTFPARISRSYRFAGVRVPTREEMLQVMLPREYPLAPTGLNIQGLSRTG